MRTIGIVVLAAMVAGCGTLARPGTPDFTRLHIDGAGARITEAPQVPHNLVVSTPRALPGFSTPRFAYMEESRELRYYGRHEWAADPARMLQPAVVAALERSGRFAAVIGSPSPALGDLRLELEIIRLLHDYRGDATAVEFSVRAQLLRFDDRRVVATRLFEIREPARLGPAEGAAAADRALARLLEALVEFTVEHTGD